MFYRVSPRAKLLLLAQFLNVIQLTHQSAIDMVCCIIKVPQSQSRRVKSTRVRLWSVPFGLGIS